MPWASAHGNPRHKKNVIMHELKITIPGAPKPTTAVEPPAAPPVTADVTPAPTAPEEAATPEVPAAPPAAPAGTRPHKVKNLKYHHTDLVRYKQGDVIHLTDEEFERLKHHFSE